MTKFSEHSIVLNRFFDRKFIRNLDKNLKQHGFIKLPKTINKFFRQKDTTILTIVLSSKSKRLICLDAGLEIDNKKTVDIWNHILRKGAENVQQQKILV